MSIKGSGTEAANRKLRLGMVGGGRGAFIGAVHRMAARLDDRYQLVAGALSSNPDNARASAADLGIDADRAYASYDEMVEKELRRDDRIDAVSIVTPNHLHFGPAKAFLEAGFHVICDKPMTFSLEEAVELVRIARKADRVFVLTQNNTGYPLVRQARKMVRDGKLGKIRVIRVSYAQDWLTSSLEAEGHKQAAWRVDPKLAGVGGSLGDIGVHAFNLAAYISGLTLDSVCADLQSFGPGRRLDDNANVLLRYQGGATGTLWASQVAPGNNNNLSIGVYGDQAGLEWCGENNDYLRFTRLGEPPQIITRGGPGADEVAAHGTRMPAGHPEGYVEGFANLYSNAADQIWAKIDGRPADPLSCDLPTVEDGALGLKFIEACVEFEHGGRGMDACLARSSVGLMPGSGQNRSLGELRRLTPDLRGLADARLVVVDNGPGRGQRMLLLRNAAGLTLEIAVDRGFDLAAITFRGINIGWNSPTGLPRPSFPHDLESGFGILRGLDGFLATCGLDNYGLPAEGSAEHLAYALRKSVHYPLHGRISAHPATLMGYGLSEGETPVLWCEGEIRQAAVFGEVLTLRRRIELRLFDGSISLSDTVTNRGFRPARHGVLYHFNVGFPFLDASSKLTGALERLAPQWQQSPPIAADDAEEEVDSFEPDADADGIVRAGMVNPALAGGMELELAFNKAQLPRLALWRCWQSGLFVVGIEPCSGLDPDALTYEGPGTGPFLEPGEIKRYDIKLTIK